MSSQTGWPAMSTLRSRRTAWIPDRSGRPGVSPGRPQTRTRRCAGSGGVRRPGLPRPTMRRKPAAIRESHAAARPRLRAGAPDVITSRPSWRPWSPALRQPALRRFPRLRRGRAWHHDGDVVFLAQLQFRELDALRQLDVRQVDDVADGQLGQVDLDELRQVLRQAADVDFVELVRDDHVGGLAGRRLLLVEEVQRHGNASAPRSRSTRWKSRCMMICLNGWRCMSRSSTFWTCRRGSRVRIDE